MVTGFQRRQSGGGAHGTQPLHPGGAGRLRGPRRGTVETQATEPIATTTHPAIPATNRALQALSASCRRLVTVRTGIAASPAFLVSRGGAEPECRRSASARSWAVETCTAPRGTRTRPKPATRHVNPSNSTHHPVVRVTASV